MTNTDVRLNESSIQLLKSCIGKTFDSMTHEVFHFRNSVSQQVIVQVEGTEIYISCFDEELPYYGTTEDVSVLSLETTNTLPTSPSPTTTPIHETIKGISIVQEHQQLDINGATEYDVWLTRGIIIDLGDREIGFEKDTWLSLEIFIHKGTDVLTKFVPTDNFINGDWELGCVARCERSVISL